MGGVYIALVLLCGATKGFCGKKTSALTESVADAVLVNCVRMGLCVLVGGVLVLVQGGAAAFAASPLELGASLLSGVFSAVFVISWMLSVRGGAYMMVEVFLLLGSGVPIFLSWVLYGERVSGPQIGGFLLLVLAVLVMSTYNSQVKTKLSPGALFLLLLCGFANGMVDFSQKLFVHRAATGSVAVYNFYSYVFAALILLAAALWLRFRPVREKSRLGGGRLLCAFGYIAVMAATLFFHSLFKTLAAGYVDAVRLYPIIQGGSMLLSLAMSAVLFKEKITARCMCGVGLTFGAMLLLQVGG